VGIHENWFGWNHYSRDWTCEVHFFHRVVLNLTDWQWETRSCRIKAFGIRHGLIWLTRTSRPDRCQWEKAQSFERIVKPASPTQKGIVNWKSTQHHQL
jgi:hypothetical protein